MPIKEALFEFAGRLFFERPSHKLSLAEHIDRLRRSGDSLAARLSAAAPDDARRKRLRHVIGIEWWGQRRLQVLLGEPFVLDGHASYLPAEATSWEELVRLFRDTRAETISIAEQLASTDPDRVVKHNQFGDLSARGWLRYLDGHAKQELRSVK